MSIETLKDFRGGLAIDKSPLLISPSQAVASENCYWDGGIVKTLGRAVYASPGKVVAVKRAFVDGANWFFYTAVDNGTDIRFYYGETTFTEIDTTYTFATGSDVKFALFGNRIVAVNGNDKPLVIYHESVHKIITLEELDERERDTTYWDAGQWDGTYYIGDTVDVQNSDIDDFAVFNTTTTPGMFVSSDLTFDKITFKGVSVATAPGALVVEYWDGSAWVDITSSLLVTPDFSVNGDTTLQFAIPITDYTVQWLPRNLPSSSTEDLLIDQYALRIRDSGSTGAVVCDEIVVEHTSYLNQIMGGVAPHDAVVYSGRLWLAVRSVLYASPYNSLAGWQAYNIEVFEEGGEEITGMVSFQDYLLVLKGAALFALAGNSYQNFMKRKLSDVGTQNSESVRAIGDRAYFLGSDGYVYAWTGNVATKISGFIDSLVRAHINEKVYAFVYTGNYYLSFPESSLILFFDPDTIRSTDMGEGEVSWFSITGKRIDRFLECNGSLDNGNVISFDPTSAYLEFTGSNNAGVPFEMRYKTGVFFPGKDAVEKIFSRIKLNVKKNGTYIIVIRNQENIDLEIEPDYVQATEPISPPTGTMWVDTSTWRIYEWDGSAWGEVQGAFYYEFSPGSSGAWWEEEISLPYFLDEQGVSFELRSEGQESKLRAIHLQSGGRYF